MKEKFRRRRLPHLDRPGAVYFVTACLDGSIPARGLMDLADYRARLNDRPRPKKSTQEQWETEKWKLVFARTERWLDREPAARHLADASLASEVENALLHFAGERYALWSWVVMPSHFHWVFQPCLAWVESLESVDDRTPRERIMHSVKRHSGRQCNLLLGRSGSFWQDESWDHCVKDLDELQRIIDYIELNPVVAKLANSREAYRFSSAYYRQQHGIPFGRPLIGRGAGL